jgi:hypothetical protein
MFFMASTLLKEILFGPKRTIGPNFSKLKTCLCRGKFSASIYHIFHVVCKRGYVGFLSDSSKRCTSL